MLIDRTSAITKSTQNERDVTTSMLLPKSPAAERAPMPNKPNRRGFGDIFVSKWSSHPPSVLGNSLAHGVLNSIVLSARPNPTMSVIVSADASASGSVFVSRRIRCRLVLAIIKESGGRRLTSHPEQNAVAMMPILHTAAEPACGNFKSCPAYFPPSAGP